MDVVVITLVVLWGLIAGWVAAWFAHRYQSHVADDGAESAQLSTAHCEACEHEITFAEAAPIRSLHCASCGESLPRSWWGTQLSVLIASLAMYATFSNSWALIPFLWLAPVLVTAAAIDLRTFLIPKRIVWVGFWVGLAAISIVSLMIDAGDTISGALIGAFAYFTVLLVFNIIYPAGMGFGDVRLAVLLGLYLGWIDLRLPIYALLISSLLSAVVGIAQRFAARTDNSGGIPFGPGLALGTFVAVVFYQNLLGA